MKLLDINVVAWHIFEFCVTTLSVGIIGYNFAKHSIVSVRWLSSNDI